MSEKHIAEAKERKRLAGKTAAVKRAGTGSIRSDTVFDQLVNSDLPESELTVERLASEAQVLMGAGTVTTARSMDHLAFYILSREDVRLRLREELKDIMADWPETTPSWQKLEKLPYLQACIKEGLRYNRCAPLWLSQIPLLLTCGAQAEPWHHAPAAALLARRGAPVRGLDDTKGHPGGNVGVLHAHRP